MCLCRWVPISFPPFNAPIYPPWAAAKEASGHTRGAIPNLKIQLTQIGHPNYLQQFHQPMAANWAARVFIAVQCFSESGSREYTKWTQNNAFGVCRIHEKAMEAIHLSLFVLFEGSIVDAFPVPFRILI